MSTITRRIVLLSTAALAGAAFLSPAFADDLKVTIGYQTVVEPSKVPQADGVYEKTPGVDRLAQIRFRRRRHRSDRIRLASTSAMSDRARSPLPPAANCRSRPSSSSG